jgi:hypothetical protein
MKVRLFCNIETCSVIVEGNGYTFYLSIPEAEELQRQLNDVLNEAKTQTERKAT